MPTQFVLIFLCDRCVNAFSGWASPGRRLWSAEHRQRKQHERAMARKEAKEHREVKRELEGLLCMHRCEWDLTESKSLPMFLSGRYGVIMHAAACKVLARQPTVPP